MRRVAAVLAASCDIVADRQSFAGSIRYTCNVGPSPYEVTGRIETVDYVSATLVDCTDASATTIAALLTTAESSAEFFVELPKPAATATCAVKNCFISFQNDESNMFPSFFVASRSAS